jgi:hypothetical protein
MTSSPKQMEPYDEVAYLPLNDENENADKEEINILKIMNLPNKKETKVVFKEFKLSIVAAILYAILSLPFMNNMIEKLTGNFYQQLGVKLILFTVLFYIIQTYFKLY